MRALEVLSVQGKTKLSAGARALEGKSAYLCSRQDSVCM